MLSWIRYIIDQKAYDEPFVKYWTNLPFLDSAEIGVYVQLYGLLDLLGFQPAGLGRRFQPRRPTTSPS